MYTINEIKNSLPYVVNNVNENCLKSHLSVSMLVRFYTSQLTTLTLYGKPQEKRDMCTTLIEITVV